MGRLDKLEAKLDEVLGKNAPFQIPENGRKTIVEYLPWVNLFLGLITLWAAWSLWHWTRVFDDYANSLSRAIGGTPLTSHRMSTVVWLGILVLVIEGALLLLAFSGTKERKKSGWDLLFYAALVNVVYGAVIFFSDYGGFGRFITSLIGSTIGLYFLFQIRSYYTGRKAVTPPAPTAE